MMGDKPRPGEVRWHCRGLTWFARVHGHQVNIVVTETEAGHPSRRSIYIDGEYITTRRLLYVAKRVAVAECKRRKK